MPCACLDNPSTVDRVAHLLYAVKGIGIDDLELIIQQAHECDIRQLTDPAEVFPVTRQALRMFWHFRCHLESVEVAPSHG